MKHPSPNDAEQDGQDLVFRRPTLRMLDDMNFVPRNPILPETKPFPARAFEHLFPGLDSFHPVTLSFDSDTQQISLLGGILHSSLDAFDRTSRLVLALDINLVPTFPAMLSLVLEIGSPTKDQIYSIYRSGESLSSLNPSTNQNTWLHCVKRCFLLVHPTTRLFAIDPSFQSTMLSRYANQTRVYELELREDLFSTVKFYTQFRDSWVMDLSIVPYDSVSRGNNHWEQPRQNRLASLSEKTLLLVVWNPSQIQRKVVASNWADMSFSKHWRFVFESIGIPFRPEFQYKFLEFNIDEIHYYERMPAVSRIVATQYDMLLSHSQSPFVRAFPPAPREERKENPFP